MPFTFFSALPHRGSGYLAGNLAQDTLQTGRSTRSDLPPDDTNARWCQNVTVPSLFHDIQSIQKSDPLFQRVPVQFIAGGWKFLESPSRLRFFFLIIPWYIYASRIHWEIRSGVTVFNNNSIPFGEDLHRRQRAQLSQEQFKLCCNDYYTRWNSLQEALWLFVR